MLLIVLQKRIIFHYFKNIAQNIHKNLQITYLFKLSSFKFIENKMASFLLNLGNYAKITIFMPQKQSNYKRMDNSRMTFNQFRHNH